MSKVEIFDPALCCPTGVCGQRGHGSRNPRNMSCGIKYVNVII